MKYYLLLFLLFVGMYLMPLGFRPMIAPDEFRYGEIPRAMVETGNWVVPRLAGMDYFEKPALGYQLTALSFKVFGYNKFALRFPCAMATGLTALLLVLFLRRYTRNDRIAALGGAIYLNTGLVFALGNCAVLDAQVTLFIAGCLISFLPACLAEKWDLPRVVLLLAAGIFAGLGFLTKGFIALAVPAIVIFPFLIWEKRWKAFFTLPWIPLAACLAVAAPWSIAIHQQAPDFWRYFVIVEHWTRFTGAELGQHSEPWWYFLALLIPLAMPAGLLLPCAVRGLRGQWGALFRQSHVRYMVCFFVFPFLFFSSCSGKLATYILPCMIPLAAMAAIGIAEYFRLGGKYRSFRWIMTILGGVLLLAGLAGFCVGFLPWPEGIRAEMPFDPALFRRFIPAGAAALVFGAVLLWQRSGDWQKNLTAFFAGQVAVLICALWALSPQFFGDKTPLETLQKLEKNIPANVDKILVHRSCMHGAAWVWGPERELTLAWSMGEWDYPIENGFRHRFMDAGEFQRYLFSAGRKSCVVLFPEKNYRRNPAYFPKDGKVYSEGDLVMIVYPAAKGRP